MNLLITGGCGFLGTNLVRYLASKRQEFHLTILDMLTYAGDKGNIKSEISNGSVSFVEGDICDSDHVSSVLAYGIDLVVNLAAETHVDRSIHQPSEFIRTNVYGVQTLLDCCREKSIPLLHISTDEVYGPAPEGVSFSEDSPLRPSSPYAASKASADLLHHAAMRTYRQEIMVLRPVNILGPYQYPEKLIPLFTDRLLRELPVPLYGDGRQRRHWLYVEDFCHAVEFAIDRFAPGEFFNLSSNNEISNGELALRLTEIIGCDKKLIRFVDDRPAHDRRYAIDGSEFVNRFGWLPQFGLDDGLRKTVDWYTRNTGWLKRRKTKEFDEYFNKQYGSL